MHKHSSLHFKTKAMTIVWLMDIYQLFSMEHHNGIITTNDGVGRGAGRATSGTGSGGFHGGSLSLHCPCAAESKLSSWYVSNLLKFVIY